MDNQFCKKCGQANLPNTSFCSKCGADLDAAKVRSGSSSSAEAEPAKKSKLPWILGGLAALLILGIGVVLLAGVGLYFYTQSSNETVTERKVDKPEADKPEITADPDGEKTDSDNPLGDVPFPSGKDVDFGEETATGISDESLVDFFRTKKSKVGRFRLVNVKTTADRSIFPNRLAGIQAEYKAGSKRIIHRAAMYKSTGAASEDIASYKQNIKKAGARFRMNKKSQAIFSLEGITYLAFYNAQGGLHEISARNPKDILRYYNSYFTR